MTELARTHLQTPEEWIRFLSGFIHELRTPMASSLMLIELLAEAPRVREGQQEKRYAENLREVMRDIQSLIGEVADLTRLLGGRVSLRFEDVALAPLVDEVEDLVRPRAWEQGVAVTPSLDALLPQRFRTDRDRLRQLLVLLLGAAVSHAKSEVLFQLSLEEGNLCAVLSSDGNPFPEKTLAALFEPFHGGARSARARGGPSLALPLTSELARTLGGALQAENRTGKPTFVLSLHGQSLQGPSHVETIA